jgi:hypothetical protein
VLRKERPLNDGMEMRVPQASVWVVSHFEEGAAAAYVVLPPFISTKGAEGPVQSVDLFCEWSSIAAEREGDEPRT